MIFPKPPIGEQVLMVFLVGHLLPKGPGWNFTPGGEIEIKADIYANEPYGDDWELTILTQSLPGSACSTLVLRDGKWERP